MNGQQGDNRGQLSRLTSMTVPVVRRFCRFRGWTVSLLVVSFISFADGITESDMATLEATRDVYHQHCGMCHGMDGVPNLGEVPNFAAGERMDRSDADLLATMQAGIGLMPSWEGVIDLDTRQHLITYVRGIPGDVVFRRECYDCHSESIPPLRDVNPADSATSSDGSEVRQICSGTDVESRLSSVDVERIVVFMNTSQGFTAQP